MVVARHLLSLGADVRAHDSHIPEDADLAPPLPRVSCDPGELEAADLVVILVDHDDLPYDEIWRACPVGLRYEGLHAGAGLPGRVPLDGVKSEELTRQRAERTPIQVLCAPGGLREIKATCGPCSMHPGVFSEVGIAEHLAQRLHERGRVLGTDQETFRPSVTTSGTPPTAVATQATPEPMASSNAIGRPSLRELNAKTSNAGIRSATSSRDPANTTRSFNPSSRSSFGPHPRADLTRRARGEALHAAPPRGRWPAEGSHDPSSE